MRNQTCVVLAVLVSFAVEAFAANPAAELARGRAALAKRDYDAAAEILSEAIPSAEALPNAEERSQALAALNFYAAIAYHSAADEDSARQHLQAFLAIQPNARIDPNVFGQSFVALFNQVRTAPRGAATVTFDSLYPTISSKAPEPSVGFVITPAFQYLATPDEKRTYDNIHDDGARAKFVEEFWKRRDPTPGDARNEFREQFLERAALADYYFSSGDVRGSLTDRGKVYLLLGKPGAIENRRFRPSDGELSLQGEYEYGETTLEIWRYPRKLLPVAIPTAGVTYMFVTHKRLGDHMLHDLKGMALRALLGAAEQPLKAAKR